MSVYAISDLHGRLDLLKQIQNFLNKNDTVYCLGDCCDRGPNPWETVKEVYKDNRFIYLKGNHEDILDRAMIDKLKGLESNSSFNIQLLYENGGEETLNQWNIEDYRYDWQSLIHKLPLISEYINKDNIKIILCHAGFNIGSNPTKDDLLWNRSHYFNQDKKSNYIIVHGHTPIPFLINDLKNIYSDLTYKNGAFWYDNNYKVDIDCGAYATGQTVLLDLDTFEEHIFYDKIS